MWVCEDVHMDTNVVATLFMFYTSRTSTPTSFSYVVFNTLTSIVEFVDGIGFSMHFGVGLGLRLRIN